MENKGKLFIISFGNSTKYRMFFPGAAEELEKSSRLAAIENELKDYLKDKVETGSHAARYATAKITEVIPEAYEKYSSYADFNDVAVDDIKKVLLTEVENMKNVRELNDNAPWGTAPTNDKNAL